MWEVEISYKCTLCPVNHSKPTFGDQKCQPCNGYFVSNKLRTKCIDPFLMAYITSNSLEGVLCIVGFLISTQITLFIIAVFVWKRETPIVKSSDRMFTFFHLFIILATNVLLPVTYYGQLNVIKCISRSCVIAILYNGNFSVILVKSNKLVQVFQSKTRVSYNEMTRTKITQLFIITINVLVGLLIVFTMMENEPSKVGHSLDFYLKIRYQFCLSQWHSNVINFLSLFIQLGCMVQAFRCRSLPDHLNEAMSILYLSFFTVVSGTILFPIYHFQKNEIDASMVHLIVFQSNNLITLLLLYCKKTYIILFRQHLNTTQYFRQQQMKAIEMKARTKI